MIAGRHVIELVTEVAVAIVEETVEAQLAKSDRDNNDHPGTEEFSARAVFIVRWSQTTHLAFISIKRNSATRRSKFKKNSQASDRRGITRYQGERERNKRQSPDISSQRRPACIYKSSPE